MATRKKATPFDDMQGDLVRAARAGKRVKSDGSGKPDWKAIMAKPVLQVWPNDQFKVIEYTISHCATPGEAHMVTVRVYLLDQGDVFEGFGGSRHGLVVRKTASLIIRTMEPWGLRDVEYDVNDAKAWEAIRDGLRTATRQDYNKE